MKLMKINRTFNSSAISQKEKNIMTKNAYAQSGVDVEAGYEVVARIKKHVARTERAGVMGALGGFGGMFDLTKTGVKEPVLISGTDGVGTKLMLAIKYDKHDTIGQDCVAMCVNDIIIPCKWFLPNTFIKILLRKNFIRIFRQ